MTSLQYKPELTLQFALYNEVQDWFMIGILKLALKTAAAQTDKTRPFLSPPLPVQTLGQGYLVGSGTVISDHVHPQPMVKSQFGVRIA